jgi:hypothetical protein
MLARESRAFAAGLAAKRPRPRLFMPVRTCASGEFAPDHGVGSIAELSRVMLPRLKWASRRAARTAKISRPGTSLRRTA